MKKRVGAILLVMFVVLVLGVNSVSAVNVTPDQVADASENVNSYINASHTIPGNTNIGATRWTCPNI